MTAQEMQRRLDSGEDPLDISIRKWRNVKAEVLKAKRQGRRPVLKVLGDTCALCATFYDSGIDAPLCEGCPINRKTGKSSCQGTPWEAVLGAYNRLRCYSVWDAADHFILQGMASLETAVDREIDFLYSLKGGNR